VAAVISSGIALQPRLSTADGNDLVFVDQLIHEVVLRDNRVIDNHAASPLSTKAAYCMLTPAGALDPSACHTWSSRLPTKVKIFSYLADIDRLCRRCNRFFKNCAPSDICAACPAPETTRHLFFDCDLAVAVWSQLGVNVPPGRFSIWDLSPPTVMDSLVWHAGCAVILWEIWKARSDLVFNHAVSTAAVVLQRASEDIVVWTLEVAFPCGGMPAP
jgi:hypothetical protein